MARVDFVPGGRPVFDRAWLLSWTCYGTWLPGDARGFVGFHRPVGERVNHNQPGTEPDREIPALRKYAAQIQKHETVRLTGEQAGCVALQFRETAAYRGWRLAAAAVMANHVHLVVLVPGDPDSEDPLHSVKSYATRRLNEQFGRQRWWTASGSTRKLPGEGAIRAAVRYVRDQENPLYVERDAGWLATAGTEGLEKLPDP